MAILPYYIANLNIEYTYQQRTGRYLEFPNLCFVDTLDNLDWQQQGTTGGAVTRQGAFNLGGLSEENWIRIQEQNEKPISVIIGNPPYNANQQNGTTTTRTGNTRDRPAHPGDLHRQQHGPEDQAVRHVQAVHPVGFGPAGRRRDHRVRQQQRVSWTPDRTMDFAGWLPKSSTSCG